MTVKQAIDKLKSLGNEKLRQQNKNRGIDDNQYGVMMGDIRKLAATIKKNHDMAMELWATGNFEARMLAVLVMDPKKLSLADVERLLKSTRLTQVADWFNSYILKEIPDKEKVREQWMKSKEPMLARAGWSLTAGRITREPDGIDIDALLDRIEKEMPKASPEAQWTMNSALAQTGINHPKHRKRALEIGEKIGLYRDYPVSKGCTSPFAPIWINEMVKRQK